MQAKKSFGQHFLHDQQVLQKIAQLIFKHNPKHVLEIGPGKAALTKYLLKGSYSFAAVEADKDMQSYLIENNILRLDQLIAEDILHTNFLKLFNGESFLLCGNFPYNISSQILIKTLQYADRIPVMVGMFQKEVAMRIVNKGGSKEYGGLSVLTQLMYDARICFDVSPGAFSPPPKVMSTVIELVRKKDALDFEEFKSLQKLVRNAFQFRRKTLRNNLKSYVQDHSLLDDAYFDQRPDALKPEAYLELLRRWRPIF